MCHRSISIGRSGPSITLATPAAAKKKNNGATMRKGIALRFAFRIADGSVCCKSYLTLRPPRFKRLIVDACGGFADDQFRLEPDFLRIRVARRLDTLDQQLRGRRPHLVQRLTH